MTRVRWWLSAVLLGTFCSMSSLTGSASAAPTASNPCQATPVAGYQHVVWIVLENVGYSVIGSPSAPYLNSLASRCGLATNYLAVSHPSLPNYIALTSGSTQGITDDAEPSVHHVAGASIFSELGTSWRSLDESMPSPCDRVTSGTYAARHNPAVYFTNLPNCSSQDLALSLPLNLSAAFTFITPNICDDMHSCSVATGDSWLRRYVPLILSSTEYRSSSMVLFITFDENDNDSLNRVPTIVVGPSVAARTQVALGFTHYSLLATTETLLHVKLLGAARTAKLMITPFNL